MTDPKPLTPAQQTIQVFRQACQKDPATFFQRVAAGLPLDLEDRRHNTLLHVLATKGRTDTLERVLALPGRPLLNRTNLDGDTALHKAAVGGHLDVVQRLIDAGANLVQRNNRGRGPLHEAAYHGHPEVVDALLAKGLTPDQPREGFFQPAFADIPPLSLALYEAPKTPSASVRQVQTVRRLLAAGANPNWHHADAMPHLCRAVHRDPEIVRALLDAGAEPDLRDRGQRTALMVACETSISDWAERARTAVTLLLAAGADPRAQDSKGWTALHMAVRHDNPDWLHALLRAGADPMARAHDGKTPMDAATMRAQPPEKAILTLTMAETTASLPVAPQARDRRRL